MMENLIGDRRPKCLFIVWSSALGAFEELCAEISKSHYIIEVIEQNWTYDEFKRNLPAFYSDYLPNLKDKIRECGVGKFKIILTCPYDMTLEVSQVRNRLVTSYKGLLGLKRHLRELAAGQHNVHASNNYEEFNKDYKFFFNTLSELGLVQTMNVRGFSSPLEFLAAANEVFDVVLMRPDQSSINNIDTVHEDIDLLVYDRPSFVKYFGLEIVKSYPFNKRYIKKIGENYFFIDVHEIYDNDVDPSWCIDIFDRATYAHGIREISDADRVFLEIYRFMFTKRRHNLTELNRKIDKLDLVVKESDLMTSLEIFMRTNNYEVVVPKDVKSYFAMHRRVDTKWDLPFYFRLRFYSRKHMRNIISIYVDYLKAIWRSYTK